MIRKQLYITHKQDELYKELSAFSGLSMSELVRRALDYYSENKFDSFFLNRGFKEEIFTKIEIEELKNE